jgi:tRNA(fMet)-specific endonuclease VapC
MDKEIICVDTSVFIDFFRKQNKSRTKLIQLSENFDLAISVITKLEILVGITKEQLDFWQDIFDKLTIIPLNEKEIEKAGEIIQRLRKENKIIGLQDILIASTAIVNDLAIATLNRKDFVRIIELKLIDIE